jgi:hypothetical protein
MRIKASKVSRYQSRHCSKGIIFIVYSKSPNGLLFGSFIYKIIYKYVQRVQLHLHEICNEQNQMYAFNSFHKYLG